MYTLKSNGIQNRQEEDQSRLYRYRKIHKTKADHLIKVVTSETV